MAIKPAEDDELEEEAEWIFRHGFSTLTISMQVGRSVALSLSLHTLLPTGFPTLIIFTVEKPISLTAQLNTALCLYSPGEHRIPRQGDYHQLQQEGSQHHRQDQGGTQLHEEPAL